MSELYLAYSSLDELWVARDDLRVAFGLLVGGRPQIVMSRDPRREEFDLWIGNTLSYHTINSVGYLAAVVCTHIPGATYRIKRAPTQGIIVRFTLV